VGMMVLEPLPFLPIAAFPSSLLCLLSTILDSKGYHCQHSSKQKGSTSSLKIGVMVLQGSLSEATKKCPNNKDAQLILILKGHNNLQTLSSLQMSFKFITNCYISSVWVQVNCCWPLPAHSWFHISWDS
jgi:hypothetical protein